MPIYSEPPPVKSEWSLSRVHQHKYKPGDTVCYIYTSHYKNKPRFQLSEVEIVAVGYDDLRRPRYEIKVIRKVAIANGILKVNKSQLSKGTTPFAWQLEQDSFPAEEWDEQITRKLRQSCRSS